MWTPFTSIHVFTSSHPWPHRGMKLHVSHRSLVSAFPSLCNDEGRRHPESQLAHLIPPSGNIKQMSASKRNQSINHSLCVGSEAPFPRRTQEKRVRAKNHPSYKKQLPSGLVHPPLVTKEPFFPLPVPAIVLPCSHSLLFQSTWGLGCTDPPRLLRVLMSRWEAEEKASHVREKMRWGDKRRRGLEGKKINIELQSVSCVQPDPYNQVVDGCVCVCLHVCVCGCACKWMEVLKSHRCAANPVSSARRLTAARLPPSCAKSVWHECTDTHLVSHSLLTAPYINRGHVYFFCFLSVTACFRFRQHKRISSQSKTSSHPVHHSFCHSLKSVLHEQKGMTCLKAQNPRELIWWQVTGTSFLVVCFVRRIAQKLLNGLPQNLAGESWPRIEPLTFDAIWTQECFSNCLLQ